MAQNDQTAARLLRRVGRGDGSAFSALYDAVAPMVYGIALRVVRDPARAEEVSQEVFLQIWSSANRFDPARGSAKAWVATIAHRRAVDVVRAEEASRRRTEAVGIKAIETDFDSVAEEAERSDQAARIRKAVSRLKPEQRECIDMAYFDGRTYREVALALDSPLGTVKTRMRSALMDLGDILQGEND